jgi:hypothetical protein
LYLTEARNSSGSGTSWYAATRSDIPLGCRAKLAVKDQVEAWRSQLSATLLVLAAIAAARNAQKTRAEEKKIVDDLVKQVLVQLQEQVSDRVCIWSMS